LLASAAIPALAALGLRSFLFEPLRAPSSAMLPTIPVGANIIVEKWGYGH
jgi:signal peptidase I